jgi:hypothetical protein
MDFSKNSLCTLLTQLIDGPMFQLDLTVLSGLLSTHQPTPDT